MSYTHYGWSVIYAEGDVSKSYDKFEDAYNAMLDIVESEKPYTYSFTAMFSGEEVKRVVPADYTHLYIADTYSLGSGFGSHHTYKYTRKSLEKRAKQRREERRKETEND